MWVVLFFLKGIYFHQRVNAWCKLWNTKLNNCVQNETTFLVSFHFISRNETGEGEGVGWLDVVVF